VNHGYGIQIHHVPDELGQFYCILFNKSEKVSLLEIVRLLNFFNLVPNVLSRILLYMTALDFLWTILWVMAWYFFLNSRSLWVDSIDSDLIKGPGVAPIAGKSQINRYFKAIFKKI
jgi:hypothetical protein